MKNLKWSEVIKLNNELGHILKGDIKKIALIGNTTNFQLKEILELELREKGIPAQIELGDYDSIVRDSLKFQNFDAVIIFWELSNLVDAFHYKYKSMDTKKINSLLEKTKLEIKLCLENLKDTPLVLINKFTSIQFHQSALEKSKLSLYTDDLNSFLTSIITKNQLAVDIEKIIAISGVRMSTDYRQFQSSKALYTKEFYFNYVEHIKYAFFASYGMVKKVLVLDCDNTLWGGIVGEDGKEGIEMNDLSNKGKSFREVQYLIKGYQQNGILLALCSKNNPEDVDDILDNHKDMILNHDDFVSKKVNWTDKAENLINLANELNLGLDSFIFVDDSEFEIGLIKREVPQIKTVLVPKDLSDYPDVIRSLERDFFSFSSTREDSFKTSMYREESKRIEAKKTFNSMDGYLESLGLNMKVSFDDEVPFDRASQMTQKTNQFNLRTKRYTESEIQYFIESDEFLVSSFSLSDNYGEYGVTGLIILKFEKSSVFIDTFLMSCRVIGRNVEFSFFSEIIKKLRKIKKEDFKIKAEWISTPKNIQVMEFYEKLGFESISKGSDSKLYELLLSEYKSLQKKYIKIS